MRTVNMKTGLFALTVLMGQSRFGVEQVILKLQLRLHRGAPINDNWTYLPR
jgi:hypothetical protein